MGIEGYWGYIFNNPESKINSEMTASQLPGRQNGGAADAYRHILLSAELTRDYGSAAAFDVLTDHERETTSGADNGLDMWNNSIGMQIGQYVRDNGGTWVDVVRLSGAAIVGSFDSDDFDQVSNWEVRPVPAAGTAASTVRGETFVRQAVPGDLHVNRHATRGMTAESCAAHTRSCQAASPLSSGVCTTQATTPSRLGEGASPCRDTSAIGPCKKSPRLGGTWQRV